LVGGTAGLPLQSSRRPGRLHRAEACGGPRRPRTVPVALLIYEGRTVNEVAEHLGHADPGFTARTYAHIFKDARARRGVLIEAAIRTASPPRTSGSGSSRALSRNATHSCGLPRAALRSASVFTLSSDARTAASHLFATRSPHQRPSAQKSVPSSPRYSSSVPPAVSWRRNCSTT
jgi:hypothetical protein